MTTLQDARPQPAYSFADCLENAHKVNWRIDDVLGGRTFDLDRHWLPARLSGAGAAKCLDADEQRKLTHVEMASYAHLFGYVEEFIAPTMLGLAQEHGQADRDAFDALANFAAEEVKHMTLFRRVRELVNDTLGCETRLLGAQAATVRYVTGKNLGAVLLLTACIEWFTQLHYRECFEDDVALDPLTLHIFRSHWLEEAQHAKLDHLETVRYFARASADERERAIDDLIELVAAVDGLLRTQTDHDVENLSTYLRRQFRREDREQLRAAILRAKRYTFLESGVTHPRFVELFREVALPRQQEKVAAAIGTLLAS